MYIHVNYFLFLYFSFIFLSLKINVFIQNILIMVFLSPNSLKIYPTFPPTQIYTISVHHYKANRYLNSEDNTKETRWNRAKQSKRRKRVKEKVQETLRHGNTQVHTQESPENRKPATTTCMQRTCKIKVPWRNLMRRRTSEMSLSSFYAHHQLVGREPIPKNGLHPRWDFIGKNKLSICEWLSNGDSFWPRNESL